MSPGAERIRLWGWGGRQREDWVIVFVPANENPAVCAGIAPASAGVFPKRSTFVCVILRNTLAGVEL